MYCWYYLDEMIFNIVYFLVCKSFIWDMSYFAHKWCCWHKLCVDCVFHAAGHIFGLCNFWLISGAASISYVLDCYFYAAGYILFCMSLSDLVVVLLTYYVLFLILLCSRPHSSFVLLSFMINK